MIEIKWKPTKAYLDITGQFARAIRANEDWEDADELEINFRKLKRGRFPIHLDRRGQIFGDFVFVERKDCGFFNLVIEKLV